MAKIIDIGTLYSKIYRRIEKHDKGHRKSKKRPENKAAPKKTLPTILIICLICTMLPIQAVTTFFSLTFATATLLSGILIWKKQISFGKKNLMTIGALIAMSVLSGCSPAFTFQTQPELIKFAREHNLEYHSIQKVGVLGLGLDSATISACQADSNIKELRGTQVDRGHGIVSIVIITVAGKS